MFGCNSIKEVYFWTATNRRLSGASWSIIAPPFIYLLGRFSGVHRWPVLGVPRGEDADKDALGLPKS